MPSDVRANPSLDLDLDQLPIERALGVRWDAQSDTFQFKVIPTNKPSTKRGILSVVSSLFDPLGFLAPFIFPVKILLQDLWRNEFLWDQELPEPYLTQWRRMVDDKGKIHCAFVMGKTRNAPVKEWSIPRLELQAAVLATRLNNTVCGELEEPIDETHFWSDSMTTLQYVRNKTRRFHTFVSNRLTEIHESTSPEQWHFVPGLQNPADDGSRGLDIESFKPGCRWWTGADFIWKPEDQWPKERISEVPDDDQELRKEHNVMSASSDSPMEELLCKYCSWPRLVRVMSYVLRFINRLRKGGPLHKSNTISLAEINSSSKIITQVIQARHFHQELCALQRGKPVN
ncbi:hypothetical protein QZH41_010889 [Actinostola sp. cb2023]|nr:hypothetical protein QZH41_010889 [Actinostola sp. cb2023]